jgi:hypothetical protein
MSFRGIVIGFLATASVIGVGACGELAMDPSMTDEADGAGPDVVVGTDGSERDASHDGQAADAASDSTADFDAALDGNADADPATDAHADADADADAEAEAGPVACAEICAPDLPAGWAYTSLYASNLANAAPDCAAAAPPLFEANGDIVSTPATCTSCDVGVPTKAGFCPITVSGYSQPACAGGPVSTFLPFPAPQCNPTNAYVSIQTTPGAMKNGECNPAPAQNPVLAPVTWTQQARGCDLPSAAGSCAAGSTCVKKPSAPFETKACVWQPGEQDCPAAFADKHVYFTSYTDSRECSACVVSYEGTCNAYVDLLGGPSVCGGAHLQVNGCVAAGPSVQLENYIPENEKCATSGGLPTGSASPDQPLTVCCAL